MKRLLLIASVCLLSQLAASPVHAVTVDNAFGGAQFKDTGLPGTTSALRPELAATVLDDVSTPFDIPGAGISGTVQSRVVREDGAGTLDFYWRVLVDRQSTGGGIDAFRLSHFDPTKITDADWRIDGLGGTAPYTARLFDPAIHPVGAINFIFPDPPVPPGDPADTHNGSYFFFLHTDATQYALTAQYDLLGGANQKASTSYPTFAPVPEPTSLASAAIGCGLLALVRRRR